jgi:hypothetical protein
MFQISAEFDLYIVSPKGWIDQLPYLDPGIVLLPYHIDVSERNPVVGKRRHCFQVVIVDGNPDEHQAVGA